MPSKARSSAGTRIYTSATLPATYDNTGFSALTFTEIGEVSDLGSFGTVYALVTFMPLGNRDVYKVKGSRNHGTVSLKLASAPTDAGQVALEVGLQSDAAYSFKVVTQSGSTFFFTAKIMKFPLEIGSVDQIMGAMCDLEIDNDIIASVLVA